MKILYICNEYPPHLHGGIGSFTRDIAEAMCQKGHEVAVWGIYPELDYCKEECINGVRVYRLQGRKDSGRLNAFLYRYELYSQLKRFLRKRHFDIIECQEWRGLLPLGLHHPGFVVRLHGAAVFFDHLLNRVGGRLSHLFEKSMMKQSNNLIAVSDFCGRETLKICGIQKSYEVIYNAVNSKKLASFSQQYQKVPGKIVFANTVTPKKGVFELVKAFEIIVQKFPYAQLYIIGKLEYHQHGKNIMNLLLETVNPKWHSSIHITGWLDSADAVYRHLAEAEVCVYPSHMEGFGIAPVEPMAMGKPVLFMQNGPGPEVIEDRVSGLLIDSTQPESIANGIEQVFNNHDLALKLGQEAIKRVHLLFDKETVFADQNEKYYANLISLTLPSSRSFEAKKILFVCNEYPPALHGGIGIFVKNVAEAMVKQGHQVMVVGTYVQKEKTDELIEGVRIVRLPVEKTDASLSSFQILMRSYRSKRKLSDAIARFEKEFKPDWIESFDWDGPLAYKPKSPLIVRLHGSHTAHAIQLKEKKSKWTAFWEKRNYRMANKLVTVSDYILKSSIYAFGKPKVCVERIYNSYNDALFKPGDPAMRDYRCILYPGKFHERKGVFELFRILKQVFEKDASAYFIFVGHHSKSNQQTLLDFIPESHHHRIQFIPAVPQQELLPLYQKAGIVIIPSRVEAFGLTAIEAMACGAATIMSDVSAAREIIDNDLNGILINPLNTEESAHRILNLLKDPDLLKKIGDAATLKVRKKFAGSQLMVENMACYLETAG